MELQTSTRVLDSSTDAKCCSLVAFGKENAWVRGILRELGIFKLNKPTLVLEDNTAAIALSGQGPTKRSHHHDISFFLFKEQVAMGEMNNTHQNPVDFFTKPLGRTKFEHFQDMIMGGDLLQGHFMRQEQQSTNKSPTVNTHSINMLTAGMASRRSGRTPKQPCCWSTSQPSSRSSSRSSGCFCQEARSGASGNMCWWRCIFP